MKNNVPFLLKCLLQNSFLFLNEHPMRIKQQYVMMEYTDRFYELLHRNYKEKIINVFHKFRLNGLLNTILYIL